MSIEQAIEAFADEAIRKRVREAVPRGWWAVTDLEREIPFTATGSRKLYDVARLLVSP